MDDDLGLEEYVHRVLEAYRKTPGTLGTVRRPDRTLAAQLFQRGISLTVVENALVLGATRRLIRRTDAPPLGTVRSLAYFLPVIEEVLELRISPDYFQYLRQKLQRISQPVSPGPTARTDDENPPRTPPAWMISPRLQSHRAHAFGVDNDAATNSCSESGSRSGSLQPSATGSLMASTEAEVLDDDSDVVHPFERHVSNLQGVVWSNNKPFAAPCTSCFIFTMQSTCGSIIDMLKGAWSDLVHAARSLTKARAFTYLCIVSLGIGMAPVIAVPYISRIPSMPPPGVNTERLVEVITTTVESRPAANSWSYPDYKDLRNSDSGLAVIAWAAAPSVVTLPAGSKSPMYPMYVSADYFKMLGLKLARGSGFEGRTDAAVIVAYGFWQKDLGADPEIIGKALKLDNVPYAVVGIAPEGFEGHLGGKSLFVPLERHPLLVTDANARFDRGREWLALHARLSDGVSIPQASAAIARITSQLAKEYPETNKLKAGIVVPYHPMGFDRSEFRRIQALALTLTGAVLFVVCLNLSGMMQVRSAMRERELAIRQAIGASRLQIARHLFSEAVLLAGAGGALASLVILNAPTVFSRLSGQPIPVQLQNALKLDLSMFAICIGICLLASLVFGFLPALRFSRPVIISALKDDAGAGGLRVGRIHRFTAALQIAIAVPLLVMGGISLDRVRSTAIADLGFESDLLYAAPLELDAGPETRATDNLEFQVRSLREKLAKAGGIASATVADGLPLDSRGRGATVSLQSEANGAPGPLRVHVTRVGDGYLNTMGIPLLSGRDFSGDDSLGSEQVTIITKALAARLFPQAGVGEAIGKRLAFGAAAAKDHPAQTLTIIGVTGDFPTAQMSAERPQLLLALAQQSNIRPKSITTDESGNRLPDLILIARSGAGEQPQKIIAALENVVRDLDPAFRRDRIVTGVSLRKNSMYDFLKQSAIAGATGGVILLLAALGIYGVVGLTVATRTREIAVRLALGASPPRVLGMILFDVLKLATPGVAIGLLLAASLIRLNGENMGISLSHVESLAYVVGAAIAVLVAVLAGLFPARRAASVLPMVAMRSE